MPPLPDVAMRSPFFRIVFKLNPVLMLNWWGGIKVRSVDEPQPGQLGFLSVASTVKQPSPLKPHLPTRMQVSITTALQVVDER